MRSVSRFRVGGKSAYYARPHLPIRVDEELQDLQAALSDVGLVLEAQIGVGGNAIVYRARDTKHDRAVAVKVMRGLTSGTAGGERFEREIAVVASLRHPHILPLYDSGVTQKGARYYVMPLVNDATLRQRIDMGPMEVREAVRLASEIADALAFAHAAGVVHRDIKPENILIESGHAVVTDFGLAVGMSAPVTAGDDMTAEPQTSSPRLTAAGFVAGTAEYMSPEQAAGERDIDGRSDIYSLGCVLYEMLAGKPPFTGSNAREILARRFSTTPPRLTSVRQDVPEWLATAVDRALALDPADRFASATAFAAAMNVVESDDRDRTPESVAVPPRGALLSPDVRRVSSLKLALGAVVFAIAGGGVILALLHARAVAAPALDARRVVVAALSNETGDSAMNPIGSLVTTRIRDGLTATRLRVVMSSFAIPALHDARMAGGNLDDPERVGTLATETQAATVISGSYYLMAGKVEFLLEITDARSGVLLRSIGPLQSLVSQPEAVADALLRRVAAAVDSLYPGPIQYDTRPKS